MTEPQPDPPTAPGGPTRYDIGTIGVPVRSPDGTLMGTVDARIYAEVPDLAGGRVDPAGFAAGARDVIREVADAFGVPAPDPGNAPPAHFTAGVYPDDPTEA